MNGDCSLIKYALSASHLDIALFLRKTTFSINLNTLSYLPFESIIMRQKDLVSLANVLLNSLLLLSNL